MFQDDDPAVERICFDSMIHKQGDEVNVKDCILLSAGHRRKPFVAKVTSLWENPENGEW